MPWRRLLPSKFHGCLIGSAVGGALGVIFKGVSFEDLEREPWPLELFDGRYTGGVKTMIRVAESLIGYHGCKGSRAEGPVQPPIIDLNRIGGLLIGPMRSTSRICDEPQGMEEFKMEFKGRSLSGGGIVVAVTPLGLLYYDDPEMIRGIFYRSGLASHLDELTKEGAVIQAYAVASSMRRTPWDRGDPVDLVEEVEALTGHPLYRDKLKIVRRFLKSTPDKKEIVRMLGNSMEAPHSVPTAIYCALSGKEGFEAAVSHVVRLGGDADVTAALTGAISGTLRCLEDIPYRWRAKLWNIEYLSDLADKLLKAKVNHRP
jgi:poly(ADP-ribose) glycohydrolase ARH3